MKPKTPEQMQELRSRIWHRHLAEMEPDERDRIRAEPEGQEAIAAALAVELELAATL